MLHRKDRKLEADHAADLARPEAAGIHHVLGVERPLVGDHAPAAVALRLERLHAREAVDLGPLDARRLRVGVGHARGIDVAFDRVVERAHEIFPLHEGEEALGLLERDELRLQAEVAPAGVDLLEPVEPLGGTREHEPAGDVHAAGLAGYLLDLLVEIDGVLLKLGDVGI